MSAHAAEWRIYPLQRSCPASPAALVNASSASAYRWVSCGHASCDHAGGATLSKTIARIGPRSNSMGVLGAAVWPRMSRCLGSLGFGEDHDTRLKLASPSPAETAPERPAKAPAHSARTAS